MIREVTEADLPAILAIVNEVIATSTAIYRDEPETLADRQAWLEGRRASGYPVLAFEADGALAGFASFGDFRPWPGYRFTVEHSVHVHAGRRGQGIGPRLVSALIPRAVALGKHVMIAGVDAANQGSIRMHERLGFSRAALLSEVGFKFGRWLNLVLLERRLESS